MPPVQELNPRSTVEDALYRKVTWRLLPFLMLCYVVAYLDRVNIGFARLQMLGDLKFSDTVYGTGAGMFFIGYFFFEVPSNVLLHRIGARIWIGRIMITWGLVSGAFMFVTTPLTFYALRFLLGLAEAGFFPGIILYLTCWYPTERRAKMTALFMAAIPASSIIGGPLSGWIMQSLAGVHGWAGWQWLFLLEAVPSIVMGVAVLIYLDNGILPARWLSDREKETLAGNLERGSRGLPVHPSIGAVLADRRIWLMSLIYFSCVMGSYALTFWMPTLLQAAGVRGVLSIGLLTALPYTFAIPAMLLTARSADKHLERRWHTAVPMVIGAIGLSVSALAGTHTAAAVVCLIVAAAGILSSLPTFWSLPTGFLGGVAAAAGIAAINSIGNLAGFASPYIIGWLKDLTHSTEAGLHVVSAVLVIGAISVFAVPARLVNR